jgi:hypothetical protein
MIPQEFKEYRQWVSWKPVEKNGKMTKIPITRDNRNASTTNPDTWDTWERIKSRKRRGFVFTKDDPFVFIDLDECIDENGKLEPWAEEIVTLIDSYTEYSPSMRGLHIFCIGQLKKPGNRSKKIEIYDSKRYSTLTGKVFPECRETIEEREEQLDALHRKYFPKEYEEPKARERTSSNLEDDEILEIVKKAQKSDKFLALWNRDTSGYNSHSEADMALCRLLSFYTQDEHQIDRLFRQSGLYRKKWDREDYRKGIFEKVLRGQKETYTPSLSKDAVGEPKEEPFVSGKPLRISLRDVKRVFRKWLYIEDSTSLDVMLGTYVANKLPGDPIWTIFIAPSSNTKTELLRTMDGHHNVYFLSNYTPATMVSGKGTQEKATEASLIYKLDGKTLIIKEFSGILSMRSEQRSEILAQLREIYDGKYNKAFGTGVTHDWSGKVGLMAACTPAYDKHYGVIGELGDRFILYRSDVKDKVRMGRLAISFVGQEAEMREELRTIIHSFMSQFGDMNGVQVQANKDVEDKIIYLACLCAQLRTHVDRNQYNKSIEYQPLAEGSARLVKKFMQLGMGIALVQGKTAIDENVYRILKKIAKDLLTVQRLKIIKYLCTQNSDNGWHSTTEVAEAVSMPTTTTKEKLEDLMVLNVVERVKKEEGDKRPYYWKLSDQINDWIERSRFISTPLWLNTGYTLREDKGKNR